MESVKQGVRRIAGGVKWGCKAGINMIRRIPFEFIALRLLIISVRGFSLVAGVFRKIRNYLRKTTSETTKRCWSIFSKIGSGVIQLGFLTLYAPLVQTEVSIPSWLTFTLAGLIALFFIVSHTVRGLRLRTGSLVFTLFVVFIISSSIYLSLKPFFPVSHSMYISNSDRGLAVFNPNRYVSNIYQINQDIRLIEANHPFHHWVGWLMLQLTMPEDQKAERISWPFRHLKGLFHRQIHTKIVFLDRTQKNDNVSLPIRLRPESVASTYDLHRTPCIYYLFAVDGNTTDLEMNLTELYARADKKLRVGTYFQIRRRINLEKSLTESVYEKIARIQSEPTESSSSKRNDKMTIAFRQRKEIHQWPDVLLYRQYDAQAATYCAVLTELLNSESIPQEWENFQQILWENAPNDRERLRLLALKERVSTHRMEGNILNVQKIPNLLLTESILNGIVKNPGDLAGDQLTYWAAKQFVEDAKIFKDRFRPSINTFEGYIREIESIHEPKQFVPLESDRMAAKELDRFFPDELKGKTWIKQIFEAVPPSRTATNQTRYWLKSATWDDVCEHLPMCHLKRNADLQPVNPAIKDLTDPSLEDAWDEVEEIFWGGYVKKALGALIERHPHLLKKGTKLQDSIPLATQIMAALSDGILQLHEQKGEIARYLDLRHRLFGASEEKFLAQASKTRGMLRFFKAFEEARTANRSPAETLQAIQQDQLGIFLRTSLSMTDGWGPLSVSLEEIFKKHEVLKWGITALSATFKQEFGRLDQTTTFAQISDAIRRIPPEPARNLVAMILTEDEDGDAENMGENLFNQVCLFLEQGNFFPESKGTILKVMHHIRELSAIEELKTLFPPADDDIVREQRENIEALLDILVNSSVKNEFLEIADDSLNAIFDPRAAPIVKNFFRSSDQSNRDIFRRIQARYHALMREKGAHSPEGASAMLKDLSFRINAYLSVPSDQRPHTIRYDASRSRMVLEPECPLFEQWLSTIQTPMSENLAKYGYPYVADALVLDLILRTLEDQTPEGYAATRFGFPQQIFKQLTGMTTDDYLRSCFTKNTP